MTTLRQQVGKVLDLQTADPVWLSLLEQADAIHATIAHLEKATPKSMMVEGSKGQPVLHPFIVEVRQQRLALAKVLKELGLKDEAPALMSNGSRAGAALAAMRRK